VRFLSTKAEAAGETHHPSTRFFPVTQTLMNRASRARRGWLKLHPFWDPLRGDPRFDKIVASLAPKATTP
jgi:cell wall assembly regulator SMI1